METLRRSKDHLSGGWDEASRLRERLHGAESLCAEMSARAAAAEPLVEEERWVGSGGESRQRARRPDPPIEEVWEGFGFGGAGGLTGR